VKFFGVKFSEYMGYHFFHWLISRSGDWYMKVNENLQDNLRSIENGVAVIDDILTQQVEESIYENQQNIRIEANRNQPQPNRALQQRDMNNNIDHINIINQVININMNNNQQPHQEIIRNGQQNYRSELN
jgi:hypothetical protein